MSDFDGLTALVTGGACGIGVATARLLAARGAGTPRPAPLLGVDGGMSSVRLPS